MARDTHRAAERPPAARGSELVVEVMAAWLVTFLVGKREDSGAERKQKGVDPEEIAHARSIASFGNFSAPLSSLDICQQNRLPVSEEANR